MKSVAGFVASALLVGAAPAAAQEVTFSGSPTPTPTGGASAPTETFSWQEPRPAPKPKLSELGFGPEDIKLRKRGEVCFIDIPDGAGNPMEDIYESFHSKTSWTSLEAETYLPIIEEAREEVRKKGAWSSYEQRYIPLSELDRTKVAMADAQVQALRDCAKPETTSEATPRTTTTVERTTVERTTVMKEPAAPQEKNRLAIVAIVLSVLSLLVSAAGLAPQLQQFL